MESVRAERGPKSLEQADLRDIVLKMSVEVGDLRQGLGELRSREARATEAVVALRAALDAWLVGFDRDQYKSTDSRLATDTLAQEVTIFDKLGYDIASGGELFLLGVHHLLAGRNEVAIDSFAAFLKTPSRDSELLAAAQYLSGMICYNRRGLVRAISHFESAASYAPENSPDFQSLIYVGELKFFLRKPRDEIEGAFRNVEDELRKLDDSAASNAQRATLYLKWGNCFLGTFELSPRHENAMVNNAEALEFFKRARSHLPRYTDPSSLLPLVIDYSLAQAMQLSRSFGLDVGKTPDELVADVIQRLRRVVLTKREEGILAQCYLMLGSAFVYSDRVSLDGCEIHLEYARHQTLSIPSDIHFYSPITKELLDRGQFVAQVEHFSELLERRQGGI